ncbi:SLC13 family permease [Glycocaulis albus]|uniref:SLC13 family permease n=1 Tax=Glycocaulis albus TaxID=1382801 RepID=A0ABQ1XZZ1_9PROT|nr:SLC13 family permease [Glycocaulis albus]GGH07536.1 SLC13 family permease [Glycocaulis albus]
MVATMALFLWGRLRHDAVALAALVACVLLGLVPAGEAFSGFGHPAVITVACVLILSGALQSAGTVDVIARIVLPKKAHPTVMLISLSVLAAFLSAFMNNVGALALLMPIALQIARKQGLAPGRLLMPLSFASILGGMTTLIGTPPNLIVSGFRAEAGPGPFAMFDFTPVGLAVAGAGIVFVLALSWLLVPRRQSQGAEGFETGNYLTEARVLDDSAANGKTLRELQSKLDEASADVLALIRDEKRYPSPHANRKVKAGDLLVIEADPEGLTSALSALGLQLEEEASTIPDGEDAQEMAGKEDEATAGSRRRIVHADEVHLAEYAVSPGSGLSGRSASDIRLRTRFQVNLLAISRNATHSRARLRTMKLKEGDVLLLQGSEEAMAEFAAHMGCVPLAERTLRIPDARKAVTAAVIMGGAVALAATGTLPAAMAFAVGVLAVMVLRIIPLRNIYDNVDWPVIVLLGALLPVAEALETTGAASFLSGQLLALTGQAGPVLVLAIILVATMTLSDFMNNAATAAVMCPVAISLAAGMNVSPDPLLMAVAVGASCAFLTPIGHQNNTLILGPGGFRFSDYWRLGLPLEIVVVAVGVPVILLVWPL